MKLLKKGDVLKQSDLKKGIKFIKGFPLKEGEQPIEIVKIRDKKYLVRRKGKCEPRGCNNACCKFFCFGFKCNPSWKNYISGFADEIKYPVATFEKRCKNLLKGGKCKVWDTKKFPDECKTFPLVYDDVYIKIAPKCSFKFVIDEVIQ